MSLHRLTGREAAWILAALVAGNVWIRVDQLLLPREALMPAFFAMAAVLMAALFAILRPVRPFAFAATLAMVLGGATGVLILVHHVLLTFDLSSKHAVILGGVGLAPFPVAAVSAFLRR